jgi:hypothetical protein
MKKPSINVEYRIESYDGTKWVEEYAFVRLGELEEELEQMKKSRPNVKFRVVRSEWEVIA